MSWLLISLFGINSLTQFFLSETSYFDSNFIEIRSQGLNNGNAGSVFPATDFKGNR